MRNGDKGRFAVLRRVFTSAAAFVSGGAIGATSWILLAFAYGLLGLIWGPTLPLSEKPLFVFGSCALGGVVIALWNAIFKSAPRPFSSVMAEVKSTGSYSMGPLVPGVVAFLLPVVFGGSIGVAAGLVGIVATLCTDAWALLRKAAHADAFSRRFGMALKILIAGGALSAFSAFTFSAGTPVPLPRLEEVCFDLEHAIQAVLLSLAGCALALLYAMSGRLSKKVADALSDKPWLRPIACGCALGAVGAFFPFVLFPGPVQVTEIMSSWAGMACAALVATAAFKMVLTALCMNMGWVGGPFFPLIFGGVCCGLAIASLSGADPALAAIVVPAALLASFSRKPLASVLIMLIICPVQNIGYLLIAALMGMLIPLPGTEKAR